MNTVVATGLGSEIRSNVNWALRSAGGSLTLAKIQQKILLRAPDDASPSVVLATLNAVLENLKDEKNNRFFR